MAKEKSELSMRARYGRLIEDAKKQHQISGLKRDKEYIEYLESRLKRFK